MTQATDTWNRLQEFFRAALDQPPDTRDAFISQICADDAELQMQLRDLLAAHDTAADFLDEPAWTGAGLNWTSGQPDSALVGRCIGGYQVTRAIASGGMGSVYEAQQENPRRTVALKVIRAGFGSRAAQRRFEFEVEALGRLQHPAIAQIFEAGAFEFDGVTQPFFAMELVNGEPLSEFARQRDLNVRQRLDLLVKVCMGVDHAHQRGVIHRDLKPGNILVLESKDGLQPKILDFGVARAVGSEVPPETLTAQGSQLIGTLAYMCPEQIFGDPRQLDTRADVYALGVLMYELLANRLPLDDLTSKTFGEALRAIREDDPPALSTIARACRGDLEWITMKAIAKEPNRRYGSPAELAADIQRHLNGEPVLAGPPGAAYRIGKWARRHRAAAFAVASIALVLVMGITGLSAMYMEVKQQRDRAETAQRSAEAAERQARALFQQSVRLGGDVAEFAEHELANLAGSSQARLNLARRALQELNVLRERAGEQDMLYLHSYAEQRVGEAQCVIGQSASALRSFETALAMRKKLAQLNPADESALRAVGVGHWRISDALILLGRLEQAQQHNHDALQILEQIHNRWGLSLLFEGVYLGIAHRRIGDIERMRAQPEAARESYARSLQYCQRALPSNSENLELLRGMGLALRGLGEAHGDLQLPEAALEHLRSSLSIFEQISDKTGPSNVWERSNRARSLLSIAAIQSQTAETEARSAAEEALTLATALFGADPDHVPSGLLAARAHLTLAEIDRSSDIHPQARNHADRALSILQAITGRDPDHAEAQQQLMQAQKLLATLDGSA